MTKLSLRHRVEYEYIRKLAIECHALDLAAHTLLRDGTHSPSRSTEMAYEELITEKFLTLAITLRTKFYQGIPDDETAKYVVECGFLDDNPDGERCPRSFTIKDICDKLIHADRVERRFTNSEDGLVTIINGTQRKNKHWRLTISMSLFSEAVLNWIDDRPDA